MARIRFPDGPRRRATAQTAFLLAVLLLLPGCGPAESPEGDPFAVQTTGSRDRVPLVVVGIDGAEWSVIRALWKEDRLPNLRRLADEGTTAELQTAYGASPVIWTTIATGRTPDVHGITDFVVQTEKGTVPVSSAVRRVPALWQMASRGGLGTATLGWWASWPAEAIEGVMVTDRAHLSLERIVYPDDYLEEFEGEREIARDEYPGLGGELLTPDPWMEDGAFRDRIMAHEARRLVGRGFDLFLVYFRAVDIASHRYWKYYEPDRYPPIAQSELDASAHIIPTVYEATDRALGDLLAACPERTNVLVVSDHGFFAGPEEPFVYLKTETLLEHMGFLVRQGDAVDFARSVAYPVDSPDHARVKRLRLSLAGREPEGGVAPEAAPAQLERLAAALESVEYEGGGAVFRVQRSNLPQGVDLTAEVSLQDPTLRIRVGSKTYDDVVRYINRISGTHSETTDGIFVARGPDFEPGVNLEGISVVDLAPTILYALGLPVAEDFAGRARVDLFTEAFRSSHELHTIPSWGTMESWRIEESPVDSQLLEELRALGYL